MTERTFETSGPRCPYCLYLHRPDDDTLYDESLTEWECGDCMKTFGMRVFKQTSWTCTAVELET